MYLSIRRQSRLPSKTFTEVVGLHVAHSRHASYTITIARVSSSQ